jgi:regulator of sigma E protease
MISILVFLFILSVLIIVHEFGHFIMAKKMGVRVEQFSLGFGPVLFKKKKKDTEYSVSLFPLGGFVKLAGDNLEEYTGKPDEYLSQKPSRRFWIIFFGPLLNYLLGILFFWVICFSGYPALTTKIGGLIDGFGAMEAGLKVGDKITAIDGKRVEYWEDLQKVIYSKNSKESVSVLLLRDGKEIALPVRIKEKDIEDRTGKKRKLGLLGITPFNEIVTVRYGFFKSFIVGFNKAKDLTVITYKSLGLLITGRLSMRESMTGPLGIFFITSQAANLGLIAILHLMAVLSLSLAIFNLLPLPILDGGHIFLLALEKIRGKALSLKIDQIVNKIGTALLISLAIFVTYNDIVRNFGDKISKFFIK